MPRALMRGVLEVLAMEAFQQRVVDELVALDEKIEKLAPFIGSPTFKSLSDAEQERLVRQCGLMRAYSEVLEERIGAFGS